MNGNEAFKYLREQKEYTVRQFAALSGTSPRIITYYESGERQIPYMSVLKAFDIFDLLQADIETYMDEYYPYKKELDANLIQWKKENLRNLNYTLLKKRFYMQLAKIRERQNIPISLLDIIFSKYQETFSELEAFVDENGNISDAKYEEYIMPLQYAIKKGFRIESMPENLISRNILEGICRTEFSVPEVAKLSGITSQHLKGCINETFDFDKMHVCVALKLCYILNLDFNDTFRSYSIEQQE